MSCSLYVGLPGCGKTTLLTSLAVRYLKKGVTVYTNVHLDLDGVVYIDPSFLGVYDISNGVVLLDEGEIIAESRSYKSFPKSMSDFFMLHRHYRCDIHVFAQRYKGVDIKIRNLCDNVYFVRRGPFGLTRYTPIEYKICVPNSGEKLGEIVEGYRMRGFFSRLASTRWILRKRYYKYFDSYCAPELPPLPSLENKK